MPLSNHNSDAAASASGSSSAAESDSLPRMQRPMGSSVRPAVGTRTGPLRSFETALGQPTSPIVLGLELLFKYKVTIGAAVVCSMLVAWAAIVLWPRSYESEARLLLRVGNENVGIDPTVTSRQTLIMERSTEEEINSALALLSSRGMAERIVDVLGPETILEGRLLEDADGTAEGPAGEQRSEVLAPIVATLESAKDLLFQGLVAAGIKQPLSQRETAIRELQKNVRISAPRESTVISVYCLSPTPDAARRIAQTYTDEFIRRRLDIVYTGGAREFFHRQIDALETRLEQALAYRASFLQEHQLVSVDSNLQVLTGQLDLVEQDILTAESDLRQAQAEVADLRIRIDETDDEIVAEKESVFDETWSGMRQTVYDLELRERDLAAKFADTYPPLQQVREQLEGARKILEKIQEERVNRNTTPNPIKLRLVTDLQVLENRAVGLASRIEQKRAQRARLLERINELHEISQELARMDRQIAVMERTLSDLKDKLEQARLIEELQQNEISSVSVLQPATRVERPAVPNKKMLAALILFLGTAAGMAIALIRESTGNRVRAASQLQRAGWTVLADIPRLSPLAGLKTDRVGGERIVRAVGYLAPRVEPVLATMLMHNPGGDAETEIWGVLGDPTGAGATTVLEAMGLVAGRHAVGRTLLVDADFAGRSLTRQFAPDAEVGLQELAGGNVEHDQCIVATALGTDLLPAGSSNESTAPMPGPQAFNPLDVMAALERFRHQYDVILVDLPAADRAEASLKLAHHLDGVIVVVEHERTGIESLERLRIALGSRLAGCILNKRREYIPRVVRRLLLSSSR
ncbi:MAG: hypothetical protein D6753_06970 [Planctomycetota bacterium]|nr:MAG: hypothetical protein D6753_06970 [Planctomycetota bacterium]